MAAQTKGTVMQSQSTEGVLPGLRGEFALRAFLEALPKDLGSARCAQLRDSVCKMLNEGAFSATAPAAELDKATIAGHESAGIHLGALVDEAQGLLTEVVAYARDLEENTRGGPSERGEVSLMDRADDWLAARAPLSTRPVADGEQRAVLLAEIERLNECVRSVFRKAQEAAAQVGMQLVCHMPAQRYELVPSAPTREPISLEEVRALPKVTAPEIDGEESDGTPRYWRNRPYVSLTKLERLLSQRGICKG